MRSWSERHRAPNYPCHAADRGLGDPVEFAASIILPTEGRHEVSLAIGIGIGIRNQNSPFEQILMPGCLARSLSGRATTQQVLVTVLRHPFGAR
jgi:hypothetical protein